MTICLMYSLARPLFFIVDPNHPSLMRIRPKAWGNLRPVDKAQLPRLGAVVSGSEFRAPRRRNETIFDGLKA